MNENQKVESTELDENAVSKLDSILSSITKNVVEMNFDTQAQDNQRSEILNELKSKLGKSYKIPPRRVLFTTQYNIGTVKLIASPEKQERREKNRAKYITDPSKYSRKAKEIYERNEKRRRKNS
jgi:hypothetical protein